MLDIGTPESSGEVHARRQVVLPGRRLHVSVAARPRPCLTHRRDVSAQRERDPSGARTTTLYVSVSSSASPTTATGRSRAGSRTRRVHSESASASRHRGLRGARSPWARGCTWPKRGPSTGRAVRSRYAGYFQVIGCPALLRWLAPVRCSNSRDRQCSLEPRHAVRIKTRHGLLPAPPQPTSTDEKRLVHQRPGLAWRQRVEGARWAP